MRHVALIVLLVVALLALTGCASNFRTPVQPPVGALITIYKAPLTTNFSATPYSTKQGKASTWYFRDFLITGLDFAWGEADIDEAARDGGLKEVEYADYEILVVFGIFGKFTVIAYGS